MATPRTAATMGFDSGGNVKGGTDQGAPTDRQSVDSTGDGKSDYVRKPTNLGPDNLPISRQPQSDQSEYRPGSNGSGAKGDMKMGVD